MLRAIIFDMDGVISATEDQHKQAFQDVLRGEGIIITDQEYYDKYLAHDDPSSFEAVFHAHQKPMPDVKRMNALIFAKSRIVKDLMDDRLIIYPGVESFVKKASQRYSLALATGANRLEAQRVLKKANLKDAFGAIVTADEVKQGKPQPESFLRALELMNQTRLDGTPEIQVSETLVIEDSPRCIQTANRLGMKTVGMTSSYKPDDLKEAHLVVDSLLGLELEKLESLFV
jgi:beta-phosphoglucomutase